MLMMRLTLPPKSMFQQSIQYKEIIGHDDYQKPIFADPVDIKFCRVDEGYNFIRSGNNSTDNMPNALITLFKRYNPNMPSFKNKSVIVFNNNEFVIVTTVPLNFMSAEIIGYELEVV